MKSTKGWRTIRIRVRGKLKFLLLTKKITGPTGMVLVIQGESFSTRHPVTLLDLNGKFGV